MERDERNGLVQEITTWKDYKADLVEQNPEMQEYFDNLSLERTIVNKIRVIRQNKGLSQKELANLIGMKQSAIARMESMMSVPNLHTLVKISRALNIKIEIVEEPSVKINANAILRQNPNRYNTKWETLYEKDGKFANSNYPQNSCNTSWEKNIWQNAI